jgi:hypothetical protein
MPLRKVGDFTSLEKFAGTWVGVGGKELVLSKVKIKALLLSQ